MTWTSNLRNRSRKTCEGCILLNRHPGFRPSAGGRKALPCRARNANIQPHRSGSWEHVGNGDYSVGPHRLPPLPVSGGLVWSISRPSRDADLIVAYLHGSDRLTVSTCRRGWSLILSSAL